MAFPKKQPCPKCKTADHLMTFVYEHDWHHVECEGEGCNYIGPGEGSTTAAIKAHNQRCASAPAQQ